mmetsp:Transcript_70053/g.130951  ORF Transcript_70053/g.130951 Transcript_70053/m.130951 type:complete len:407 (+) Transcript_70053:26-1246(+)
MAPPAPAAPLRGASTLTLKDAALSRAPSALSRGPSALSRAPSGTRVRKQKLALQALPDDSATQSRLMELMNVKMEGDDPAGWRSGPSSQAGTSPTSLKARRSQSEAAQAESTSLAPSIETEHLRNAYVAQVCSDTTRFDVRQWVSKIFYMHHARQQAAEVQRQVDATDAARRRRGQSRHPTHTSEAASLISDTHSQSSRTSDVATTAFQTARTARTTFVGTQASTVAESQPSTSARLPMDALSAESLVVNHDPVDKEWSMRERLKAYLSNNLPELTQFVDESVLARTEVVRREVDQELKEKHLRMMNMKQVFDARANHLRWEHIRRATLQRRLDNEMMGWILEAIEAWDHKKALERQAAEISETDLVFDYLTKRAAHIDSGKLPTELPIFKTLHASYSLPSMWRDR